MRLRSRGAVPYRGLGLNTRREMAKVTGTVAAIDTARAISCLIPTHSTHSHRTLVPTRYCATYTKGYLNRLARVVPVPKTKREASRYETPIPTTYATE